jgi:hypothetical protein
LNQQWPPRISRGLFRDHSVRNRTSFLTVGKPWLLGSIFIGAPVSLISYFITKPIVASYHRRHPHPPVVEDREVEP